MNYHQTRSSADHSPYCSRLFWMFQAFGSTSEVVIRNDLDGRSCEGWAVEVPGARTIHWDVCAVRGLDCSCSSEGSRFTRSSESDETLSTSANVRLSTGSASTLSVEDYVSSHKHLLWRVQGRWFSEHLFSQNDSVTEPGPARIRAGVRAAPPPLHLAAVPPHTL